LNLIDYLEFPNPPVELLESVDVIIAKERIASVTSRDFFQLRAASDELIAWCNDNIKGVPFPFKAQYQIIGYGIPIHRDRALPNGKPRTLAFNYLLDCGGEDVVTSIYDDSYNLIESHIIKLHRWHSIKVDMLHGVSGLTPGRFRIAISLAPVLASN
jgi:hypothetical protein